METLQLSSKRLRCSLSFIAWMERVTTQHKYLNFSLFLAGLLQHTHEQIAFVFAGSERSPAHSCCSRAGAPAPAALSALGKLVPGALSGCRSGTVVDHEEQHRQKLQWVNPLPGAGGEISRTEPTAKRFRSTNPGGPKLDLPENCSRLVTSHLTIAKH